MLHLHELCHLHVEEFGFESHLYPLWIRKADSSKIRDDLKSVCLGISDEVGLKILNEVSIDKKNVKRKGLANYMLSIYTPETPSLSLFNISKIPKDKNRPELQLNRLRICSEEWVSKDGCKIRQDVGRTIINILKHEPEVYPGTYALIELCVRTFITDDFSKLKDYLGK